MHPSPLRDGILTVSDTPGALAEQVAAWLTERAVAAERFTVCLSGGSTPKRLFETLASPAFVEIFPWKTTHWFWGDERFVPADHPDSNFHMTDLAMLSKAPVPKDNVHRIATEAASAETAASDYEHELKTFYGAGMLDPERPLFDVTFLGLGPDGHTASLLPGEPVLDERSAWVAAVTHGRPEARITLTYPPLESSKAVAFLVAGADKSAMLAHVRSGATDVPAGAIAPVRRVPLVCGPCRDWWRTAVGQRADLRRKIVMSSSRVDEILSWYGSENPGTLTNLARMMNHGRLAGTGKLVILPVDQGFEHGPARSFAPNPPAYDPLYHFQLAIEAGCNAYAAPLGFLEAGAREFAGKVPLILKINDHDLTADEDDPNQAQTGTIEAALRLGCCAIGFTIYPGSSQRLQMYNQIRALSEEAKHHGLAVIIWSYARGTALSKEGQTAIDITGYAAHIAAQLGANIIKVKLPTAHLEQPAAKKVYEAQRIPIETMAERVKHVVQCTFGGRRIVIFSGGETTTDDAKLLDGIQAIQTGGGFGSIIGRNSFQRSKPEALKLLGKIMDIYAA